jgi:alpha-tubulin suppressor-like RCC1 family protein
VTYVGTAVPITAGGAHSCAVLANGFAKCWGANAGGQLGNGTTTDASTAVVVSGI